MTAPAPGTPAADRPAAVAVPVWAWALVIVAAFGLYLMTQENGWLLSSSATEYIHEFFHDGRHALGVPCH